MNYLQLFFRDRPKCLLVPLADEEFERACELRGRDFAAKWEGEAAGRVPFEVYTTQHGQEVSINGARVQMIRFLLEPHDVPKFDESALKPSQQYPENEKEVPDNILENDIYWNFSLWLAGRSEPIHIMGVSGMHWQTIPTSLDVRDEPFFFVIDGSGEELAVRIADIDLLVGMEVMRYSEEQSDAVKNEVR